MIPENTVPPPEMVGMITTIAVKVNPEREDSETRTVSFFSHFAWFLSMSPILGRGKSEILDFRSLRFFVFFSLNT